MDKNALKYYRIIGKLQSQISQSVTFDEAVKVGVKEILKNCAAEYAILWYLDGNGDGKIHPYYWACPADLTHEIIEPGKGIVGKVVEEQKPVNAIEYLSEFPDDPVSKEVGFKVTSLVCVPFNQGQMPGCIEFFKSEDTGLFTEEEADVCQLLAMLAEMAIDEHAPVVDKWENRDIIMSAKEITREFQNGEFVTQVLKGVNLDIHDGEFVVLLGESGCGKSTFLNIIGGMDKANSGSFSFMGKDLTNATPEELTKFRRENIGFIFQNYSLMPNLNAKQNLDLIAELVEQPMDSLEALELVGLKDKASNYPSQLSGGQQQRVSIARALVKNPKIIFADEPTAALDYATSIEVLSSIEKIIKTKGTTLLMVTHNEEITKMANRVVRMRNGKTYEVTINRNPCKATELVW